MLMFMKATTFLDINRMDMPFPKRLAESRVYNFTSLLEGVTRLFNLVPPFNMDYDALNFDITYANYILNNDVVFCDLMRIMTDIYNDYNVIILVGNEDEFVSESLQKFIQSRYGVISYNIEEYNDIPVLDKTEFDINGVFNIDNDMERYSVLLLRNNPDMIQDIQKWS